MLLIFDALIIQFGKFLVLFKKVEINEHFLKDFIIKKQKFIDNEVIVLREEASAVIQYKYHRSSRIPVASPYHATSVLIILIKLFLI